MGSRGARSGAGKAGGGGGRSGEERLIDGIVKVVQSDPDNPGWYRIHKLREVMRERGMSDAEFDKHFDALWAKEMFYPAAGENSMMTAQQIKDSFVDSNGYRHYTFRLWHGWKDKRVKPPV